jgi:hypothetical protein
LGAPYTIQASIKTTESNFGSNWTLNVTNISYGNSPNQLFLYRNDYSKLNPYPDAINVEVKAWVPSGINEIVNVSIPVNQPPTNGSLFSNASGPVLDYFTPTIFWTKYWYDPDNNNPLSYHICYEPGNFSTSLNISSFSCTTMMGPSSATSVTTIIPIGNLETNYVYTVVVQANDSRGGSNYTYGTFQVPPPSVQRMT